MSPSKRGEAYMVDVSEKGKTKRVAVAEGRIVMQKATFDARAARRRQEGRRARRRPHRGHLAAKRTHELIPLCHPLAITKTEIEIDPDPKLPGYVARATVKVHGQTGVEMEALVAVSVALLTIYDMVKAVERGMRIEGVRLLVKTGGQSGRWKAAK